MKSHVGSSFDSWLHEERIYEDITGAAINRVLSRQKAEEMTEKHVTKAELANRVHAGSANLDRSAK